MRIVEQVDEVTKGLYRYCWMLEGISGRKGEIRRKLEFAGWKWLRGIGCPGSYITEDYSLAMQTGPHMFGCKFDIISNGTHAIHNRPMY